MTQHTDTLITHLTRLLNDPGRPEEALTRLISADAIFGHLDKELRSGAALPTPWNTRTSDSGGGGGVQSAEVTDHYDALSEALRETGEAFTCRRALSRARQRWALLRNALACGAPLPQPWQHR